METNYLNGIYRVWNMGYLGILLEYTQSYIPFTEGGLSMYVRMRSLIPRSGRGSTQSQLLGQRTKSVLQGI